MPPRACIYCGNEEWGGHSEFCTARDRDRPALVRSESARSATNSPRSSAAAAAALSRAAVAPPAPAGTGSEDVQSLRDELQHERRLRQSLQNEVRALALELQRQEAAFRDLGARVTVELAEHASRIRRLEGTPPADPPAALPRTPAVRSPRAAQPAALAAVGSPRAAPRPSPATEPPVALAAVARSPARAPASAARSPARGASARVWREPDADSPPPVSVSDAALARALQDEFNAEAVLRRNERLVREERLISEALAARALLVGPPPVDGPPNSAARGRAPPAGAAPGPLPTVEYAAASAAGGPESYEELLELQARIGAVPRGLAPAALARIPTRPLRPSDLGDGSTRCAVCFEDYEAGEAIRALPCSHLFHQPCIDRWLTERPTCPVCNRDLRD